MIVGRTAESISQCLFGLRCFAFAQDGTQPCLSFDHQRPTSCWQRCCSATSPHGFTSGVAKGRLRMKSRTCGLAVASTPVRRCPGILRRTNRPTISRHRYPITNQIRATFAKPFTSRVTLWWQPAMRSYGPVRRPVACGSSVTTPRAKISIGANFRFADRRAPNHRFDQPWWTAALVSVFKR